MQTEITSVVIQEKNPQAGYKPLTAQVKITNDVAIVERIDILDIRTVADLAEFMDSLRKTWTLTPHFFLSVKEYNAYQLYSAIPEAKPIGG